MTSAATFASAGLAWDDALLLARLLQQIEAHKTANLRRDIYYRGQDRVRDLGIAVPPGLGAVQTAVGWPTLAVDAIEERLDIEGWALPSGSTEDHGIDELWLSNGLDVEAGPAHTDTLIYGLEFAAASIGDSAAAEPEVLLTIEPPTRMTGEYDRRTRRLSAAASQVFDDDKGRPVAASLYLPNETIILDAADGRWVVKDRIEHKLGRVPVVRLVNRPRSGRAWGTSQISRAIIGYTDAAVRTILGMEIAREFYSSPQRYALGVDQDSFVDANGNPKTAWEVYLGRFLALKTDDDATDPKIGQLPASSPAPYLDQVKGLASLTAAEIGCPVSYMGFNTDNPPSGDGMRMLEARLVKQVERRQRVFGAAWPELMRLGVKLRDGDDSGLERLSVVWRDAATPTRAASADAAVKLVTAGIIPARSEVTYEMLGMSETTKQRLLADARRERATTTVAALAAAAQQASSDPRVAQLTGPAT